MEPWITTTQAAENTSFSQEYLARLCQSGKLRAKKAGRDWLIDPDSLQAYVDHWTERKPGPKPKK